MYNDEISQPISIVEMKNFVRKRSLGVLIFSSSGRRIHTELLTFMLVQNHLPAKLHGYCLTHMFKKFVRSFRLEGRNSVGLDWLDRFGQSIVQKVP